MDERRAEGLSRVPGAGAVDRIGCADEIAIAFRGNAFRVVYALHLGADLWVIHAFQKKSVHGIKTPKQEVDLIKVRLKRLKEMLE